MSIATTFFNTTVGEYPPKADRIPGNGAVWVGIFAEMTEFALMFMVYFLARVHYQEIFAEGPLRLNTMAGMLNTLAMLTSSYFVARAMNAIRADQLVQCGRFLWGAVGCGVVYLIIKYWEYRWNIEQGIEVETNLFFGVYYYMTFNHFLHVGWGSGAIIWGIWRLKTGAYSAKDHEGLEAIASYWHMIDLTWIVMFPLLYVFR